LPDTPVTKRKFQEKDWQVIADFVSDETARRARNRRHLETQWKEIDRQLRMEPVPKVDTQGRPLKGTEWMSALELPLQAQAAELLNADARRMQFATDRNFFSAHAAMDDTELRSLEEATLTPGMDELNQLAVEAVSAQKQSIDQDDLDSLVEGSLIHHHALYDFRGVWDNLNLEAFKYGTMVGRALPVTLDKFTNEYRGVFKNSKRVPVLRAQSVKNTYLDDTFTATMHEGLMVAPSFIYSKWQILDDLRLAASKGSADPTKPTGGWRPNALKGLEPLAKDNKSIQILEFEGDLLVPRNQGPSMFLPNVVVSVVVGRVSKKTVSRVIRYRELEFDFRTYLSHPYHQEDVSSPYGVSPLMKGAPIQAAATDAMNRMMDAAALRGKPPVAWSPQDQYMEAQGGAEIFPGAQWPALTVPTVMEIGDPAALLQIYLTMVQHYAEVTGISAPRLGAQTKSHQTAFAIDTEQTRGVVRTVDYVRSVNMGPMNSFLSMEYDMVRKLMGKELIYLPKLKQYVEIEGKQLPKTATFEVHGAGGPVEEQETAQRKQLALQLALQIDQVRKGLQEPGMDLEAAQRKVLEEGGWIDVEQFFGAAQAGTTEGPAVPGASGVIQEDPADALAALQSVA